MSEPEELKQNEDLEQIAACGPTDAEMIQEILQNNGIESNLQGEASANALPATGDLDEVRIWVRAVDAVRAKELVDAFFTPVSPETLEAEAMRDAAEEDDTES